MAILDSVGSGNSIKSIIQNVSTLFDFYKKDYPLIHIFCLDINQSRKDRIFKLSSPISGTTLQTLTFLDPFFPLTHEKLKFNQYPYIFSPFIVPFDVVPNTQEAAEYCKNGSFPAYKWGKQKPKPGRYAQVFEEQFLPYYLSNVFSSGKM